MASIKVGKPAVVLDDENIATIFCPVSGKGLPDKIWFQVPRDYLQYISLERPDWIPVSLLMPAMVRRQDLDLEFSISEKLHFSLIGDLQYILGKQDSRLKAVGINTKGTLGQEAFEGGKAVGTGFSAGIDSFYTIARHSHDETHPSFKLSHLVVNNVGALGVDDKVGTLFRSYCERTEQYARQSGLDFVPINSNLADFYQDYFSFQQTSTLRNAAAILLLQKLFRRYFYSSSYDYRDFFIGPTQDCSHADPSLLILLSTEHLEFVSSGSDLSRLEKARIVSDFPDSYRLLDICLGNATSKLKSAFINCSTNCWKCRRHLYTLELLGKLDEYSGCFDISEYETNRASVVTEVFFKTYGKDGNINDRDVIELAKGVGRISPFRVKIISFALRWMPIPISWRLCRLLV